MLSGTRTENLNFLGGNSLSTLANSQGKVSVASPYGLAWLRLGSALRCSLSDTGGWKGKGDGYSAPPCAPGRAHYCSCWTRSEQFKPDRTRGRYPNPIATAYQKHRSTEVKHEDRQTIKNNIVWIHELQAECILVVEPSRLSNTRLLQKCFSSIFFC